MNVLSRINAWANAAPWHTWILHAVGGLGLLVCAAVTNFALWLVGAFSPLSAGAVAVGWFFVWREAEQYAHRAMSGVPTYWTDVVMDIVAPVLAVTLVVLVL